MADLASCAEHIERNAKSVDVYVGAAPRTRKAGGKAAIDHAWCLWVDCDDDKSVERLLGFTPSPALIVRSGTGDNAHAWWPLTRPLPARFVEQANRRLAHHLGADPKCADAARILRPPGTLNHKHPEPTPVTVAYQDERRFTPLHVVGNIPDPPANRPVVTVRQPRPNVDATDPLNGVSADQYYSVLTGREVGRGNVTCPFHSGGRETKPSMRLYGNGTWACFGCPPQGNGKTAGGGVFEFASRLWGLDTRGVEFLELRDRLKRELRV